MTNNIPPEIADDVPASAPVRISPEVRELIRQSLYMAAATFPPHTKMAARFAEAIAFVEALP